METEDDLITEGDDAADDFFEGGSKRFCAALSFHVCFRFYVFCVRHLQKELPTVCHEHFPCFSFDNDKNPYDLLARVLFSDTREMWLSRKSDNPSLDSLKTQLPLSIGIVTER